ncbi:MAG: hypothetical protein RL596_1502 [Bacteroidota bacterium]
MSKLHVVQKLSPYIQFLIRFLALYAILYFGTYAFIGLSTEGGIYLTWLKYVDYVSLYRRLLLSGAAQIIEWMGYYTQQRGTFLLYINGANGIQLVYWCLGIGIISFWVSYVLAFQTDSIQFRLRWIIYGIFFITVLNIFRISLILIANYVQYASLFEMDHHDLYNIILYLMLGVLLLIHKKKQYQA